MLTEQPPSEVVLAAIRATEELLRKNFLLSDVTAEEFNEVAAIITRHLAVTAEPKPESSDASWRLWFDRMGDKASAEVVNWTANLVTNERLIALAEAGILPSPEIPVGGEVNQLIQDLASFPFDTLMDENAPRIAIIGSVSTLRHMQARAQEIVAAPTPAAGDDEGEAGSVEERLLFASDVCRNQQLRISELERRYTLLLRYADHQRGCTSYTNGPCTCGLESAMRSFGISDPRTAGAFTDNNKGVWFKSAVSGLWYENHKAAGTITTVKVDGTQFNVAALRSGGES